MTNIIEQCARAVQLTKMRNIAPQDQQAWLNKTWLQSFPDAKAVLQTLADNLDEGALEASFKEWDKKDWTGWPDTVAAIQAYLRELIGGKR